MAYNDKREGYLRTSSEEYSIRENDIDNKFVHLTNDAVQKYSDKYGQAEQGNKLSYDEFQVTDLLLLSLSDIL